MCFGSVANIFSNKSKVKSNSLKLMIFMNQITLSFYAADAMNQITLSFYAADAI